MIPQWLLQGGWTLWLLVILSIISITIIVFKTIEFCYFGVASKRCYRGHFQPTSDLAAPVPSRYLLSQVVDASEAILSTQLNVEHATRLLEESAIDNIEQRRSGLKALEVISMIAPLLGLLGTVLGMIEAFDQLKSLGMQVDPSVLSAGISKALVTTAAGLIVALPALCGWHICERLLLKAQRQIESILTRRISLPSADTQ